MELLTFFSGCSLKLLDVRLYDPWLFDVFELFRIVAARLSDDHFARLVTEAWLPHLPVRVAASFPDSPSGLLTTRLIAAPTGRATCKQRRGGSRTPARLYSLREGASGHTTGYCRDYLRAGAPKRAAPALLFGGHRPPLVRAEETPAPGAISAASGFCSWRTFWV